MNRGRSTPTGRRSRPTRRRSAAEEAGIRRARERQIAAKRGARTAAHTRKYVKHVRPAVRRPPFDGGVHNWYYLIELIPQGEETHKDHPGHTLGSPEFIYIVGVKERTPNEIAREVRDIVSDHRDYDFVLEEWGYQAIYHR